MIIDCIELTTCEAADDGEMIRLGLVDASGNPVSLRVPFEHAELMAMTLPRLLTRAVKAQTGEDNARYVFPLGQWFLEAVKDRYSFVLTLTTPDGFEVSFRIPVETCHALGWTLHHEAAEAIEINDMAIVTEPPQETGVN